jgi:3-oxoacyl-[acyl-carrier protein] reductase
MGSLTVAIVTGRGWHRTCDCERLAQDSATVVMNYGKSADKAKQVVAGIEAKGGKALAFQADMSKVGDVGRLVKIR